MPATFSDMCSLIDMVSIVLQVISLMTCIALLTRSGISKKRANPFPDPVGMIASAVVVLIRAEPTSLTVPSPPTATTTSYLPAACLLNSFAYLV